MRIIPRHRAFRASCTAALACAALTGLTNVPRASTEPAPRAASTSTAISCGGVVKLKPTGQRWICTFDDEFAGTALKTARWAVQTTAASGFHSGPECFKNRAANVSVSAGYLRLTARREAAPFTCTSPLGSYQTQYTSGSVSTFGTFSQAYGRFEVRAILPAAKVQGLQESFWMWPVNSIKYGSVWPASGEIDIAEIFSKYPDRAIPFIHYNAAAYDPNVTNNYCLITNIASLHTYAVEWTPTAIKVIYDGHTCLVDSWNPVSLVKPQPFDQPFMIALTQALGIGANAFSAATTPLPATTKIDYVRTWK
jgi:beta-glucanase (GH16 family)